MRGGAARRRSVLAWWSDPGTWVTLVSGHMGDTLSVTAGRAEGLVAGCHGPRRIAQWSDRSS